jgi:hypothetical protein
MADQGPKSAFEIAMERLRLKDVQDGVDERPRTDRQKAAIAAVRSVYSAKLAQEEIMHRSHLAQTLDQAARAVLEEQYHRERERLTAECEAKIDRIRHEEGDA